MPGDNMELKPRRDRRREPKAKVSGVDLVKLRRRLEEAGGDVLLSPSKAAEYCRAAQAVPSVTRQLVALWAQRHGDNGTAYVLEYWRWGSERMRVSLAWLVLFLERTDRGLEAPANG